jgi:hypothetical protein
MHIFFNPGEEGRADSGRKTAEIAGTWKQYFDQKFFEFFRQDPVTGIFELGNTFLTSFAMLFCLLITLYSICD